MKGGWVYPFIIVGGTLQTFGAAMNGQLNIALTDPWLASTVSFGVITAFFSVCSQCSPRPCRAPKA
jgi:bacterial/archaeal transporter family-2 protein